jgi:hypothetical protein
MMKRTISIAALVLMVAAAAGVPSMAQDIWNADNSLFVELNERYDAVSWAAREVTDEFVILRDLALNGLAAPDATSQAAHAQTLLLLLVGLDGAGLDPQSLAPSLRSYIASDRLAAKGGLMGAMERSRVAVEAYLEFARSNSNLLTALWAAQAGVSDLSPFAEVVEMLLGRVFLYWSRVPGLGQLALDAARRAAETTDPDALSSGLLTIYACAATAGGYGVITTLKGPTPPRDQIPSSMRDFLVWANDLYERLIDAFAAAQSSG